MFVVPGYLVGERLGDPETSRIWRATATADGRPVVLRRSTVAGIVARDGLRTAVARVAGLRSPHLVVPTAVVTTPEGLVVVYEADIADVWTGTGGLVGADAVAVTVAAGVAAMHDAGLAHGALVPEAVWFAADGAPRLACLPGPEAPAIGDDRRDLERFLARIGGANAPRAAGERDLLARLAPFAEPVPRAEPPDPPEPFPALVASAERAAADDVVRAPLPNRPLSTPPRPAPAPTRSSPWSKPAYIAIVGAAVLAAAAGVGVVIAGLGDGRSQASAAALTKPPSSSSQPTPQRTPTATSSVTRTTPTAPSNASNASPSRAASAPTGDEKWARVITALDATRDAAFTTADASRLGRVYVPGSAALSADGAKVAALVDRGWRADGLSLVVHDVRFVNGSAAEAVLLVTDELSPYRVVDGRGVVVGEVPRRANQVWLMTLRKVGASWRIAAILKGA